MKNQSRALPVALVSFIAAIAFFGCTEKRPYKEIDKNGLKLETKADICGSTEFAFAVSVNSAPEDTFSLPHYGSDVKVISFKCAENALEAYAAPTLAAPPVPQAQDKAAVKSVPASKEPMGSLLFSIPIRHVDYHCATDPNGRCTNKEEEDDKTPWEKRRYVELKPEAIDINEGRWLPEAILNDFARCLKPDGKKLIDSKIKPDAINLVIEQSFKPDLTCAKSNGIEAKADFKVRFQYSIVRLESVSSPHFLPLEAAKAGVLRRAFLTNRSSRSDLDDKRNESGALVQRWQPDRQIVLLASKSFLKPENKPLKEAADAAAKIINDSLRTTGSQLSLVIGDLSPDQSMGDIRLSTIMLDDNSKPNGLLANIVTNSQPRTGEMISARVVLYLEGLKERIRRLYDDAVRDRLTSRARSRVETLYTLNSQLATDPDAKLRLNNLVASANEDDATAGRDLGKSLFSPERLSLTRVDLHSRPEALIYSKNCWLPSATLNVSSVAEAKAGEWAAGLNQRYFNELSNDDQQKVMAALAPLIATPLLVHEMGHALGLRHNFAGSIDQNNFSRLGDQTLMTSSVMDLGPAALSGFPMLGAYDLAALGFAYAANTPSGAKSYLFCSDENVGVNATCGVQDQGANFSAIVQNQIETYEKSERLLINSFGANLRPFALSELDDLKMREETFSTLRLVFERYEEAKYTLGLSDNSNQWNSQELKDLKKATQLAAQFLVKVVATPDLTCAVADTSEPTNVSALIPLHEISPTAIDCFDSENIRLNDRIIVGQTGRPLISRRDPKTSSIDANTVGVRGIWVDKILALKALSDRRIGLQAADRFQDNFFDIKDISSEIKRPLAEIAKGGHAVAGEISTLSGQVLPGKVPVSFQTNPDGSNRDLAIESLDAQVVQRLGLDKGSLRAVLAQKLRSVTND